MKQHCSLLSFVHIRMQGKILGPEWETVRRRLNKIKEEFRDFYCSLNIIRLRLIRVGHMARAG